LASIPKKFLKFYTKKKCFILNALFLYIVTYRNMHLPQWAETLLTFGTNYQLYSRANGSYLIMDTTFTLQVLEKHSYFQSTR